jgi:hypothetical protein
MTPTTGFRESSSRRGGSMEQIICKLTTTTIREVVCIVKPGVETEVSSGQTYIVDPETPDNIHTLLAPEVALKRGYLTVLVP